MPSRFRRLLHIPVEYFKEKIWEDDHLVGLRLVKHSWKAGGITRFGLIVLPLFLLAAGFAMALFTAQVPGEPRSPVVWVALVGMVLGSAYGLTAASRAGVWWYTLVSAYIIFYGVFPVGSLAGKPPFTFPTLWALWIGWRTAAVSNRRSRWMGLLIMCLGAGYITFNSLLGKLVAESWRPFGRWAWGGILFLILAGLLRWDGRNQLGLGRPAGIKTVFWGTIFVTGSVYLAAWWKDPAITSQNTLITSQGLLGFMDLFWFYLGWAFFEGAIGRGRYGMTKTKKIIPERLLKKVWPVIWVLVGGVSWLTTHPLPTPLAAWMVQSGWQAWLDTWPLPLYFTLYGMVYASAAVLLWGLLAQIFKRLTARLVTWMNTLWLGVGLGLFGFFESMLEFSTLEVDAQPGVLSVWSAFVLVGAMTWELAKTWSGYWKSRANLRLITFLSGLSFVAAITTVTIGAGLPDVKMESTLYSFLGAVYLGVPLAFLAVINDKLEEPLVTEGEVLKLVVLGAASAILVLGINPWPGWVMGLSPLVWGGILFFVTRREKWDVAGLALQTRQEKLTTLGRGFVLGALVSVGFVTFWMSPEYLPVPFLRFLSDWQLAYTSLALGRPMLQAGQLWLTLLAVLCGGSMGMVFSWLSRNYPGKASVFLKIILTMGIALLFGWLAPWLVGG